MPVIAEKLAKPFLKWAGGKTQLLDEIAGRLPDGLRTSEIDTYIEPFVSGDLTNVENFESSIYRTIKIYKR